MKSLIVSERDTRCRYVAYVAGACAAVKSSSAAASVRIADGRVGYMVRGAAEPLARLRAVAEDKIAEVICIGYKYEFLRSRVNVRGLTEEQREILLAAIIAADFAEDKKYVRARIVEETEEHCIDGFFRFRLRPLADKWNGVAACIPAFFSAGQLAEFMEYMLRGSNGRVFLKGEDVFDSRCRRLRRAALIEEGKTEISSLREIVLSGAGKVECLGALSSRQEHFLRTYYAGRVGFACR